MIRSQILLEKWQYEALKRLAAKEGTSLSATVRGILKRVIGPDDAEKKRLRIVGLFSDPGFSAKDHDKVLYSHWKEPRVKSR